MSMPLTVHELRGAEEDRRRQDAIDLAQWIPTVQRRAPVGRYLDGAHLVAALGQSMTNALSVVAWRLVVGHLAPGAGAVGELLAAGLKLTPAELAAYGEREVYWDPTEADLAGVPERIRARIVGPRPSL